MTERERLDAAASTMWATLGAKGVFTVGFEMIRQIREQGSQFTVIALDWEDLPEEIKAAFRLSVMRLLELNSVGALRDVYESLRGEF